MDGTDIIGRSDSFYSIDYGKVTHKKISGLIQSKFKAVPFKTGGDNSKRGWRFQKDAIDRIALQYANEIKEIKILSGLLLNQITTKLRQMRQMRHIIRAQKGFLMNLVMTSDVRIPAKTPHQNHPQTSLLIIVM